MAGDPLKKVKTGEALKIPAGAYNAFIDAANQAQTGISDASEGRADHRSSGIIRVKNMSLQDRDRFDVLGISGPLISHSTNLPEFKNHVVVIGVKPEEEEHGGKFVILMEPCKAGGIAQAMASGLVVCRLLVEEHSQTYIFADVIAGDATRLCATSSGAGHILWREGGTGQQWALVRIANPSSDVPIPCTSSSTTETSTSETSTSETTTETTETTEPPTTTTQETTEPPTTTDEPPTTTQEPCPDGMTEIDVVTDVYCEDGEIVICTTRICVEVRQAEACGGEGGGEGGGGGY